MFDTPLRSAALGVLLVAAITLILSLDDRLLRLIDRRTPRTERNARRVRLRSHVLVLVGVALGLVLFSEILR